MLLQVSVDQQTVSETLTAYQSKDDVLLPLGELARLLTIAITTQPTQRTASGFVLEQDRSFSLDLAQAMVWLDGRGEALDLRRIEVLPDDIYVSSRLLARWLPVDLDVDMSRLSLAVRPREQLPLQFRLDREEQAGRLGRPPQTADPGYPRHDIPYGPLGLQFVDQTLSVDYRGGNGTDEVQGRYSAYATGDLLGMEGALYANAGSDSAPDGDVRLTLGRNDPDAGLLGPLRARTVLFGSIPMAAMANISRTSASGEGMLVSNRPLSQSSSFGQHSLQGPLPPGWDVELFFNDVLVGFQASVPDGQYHFNELELLFGPNEFRLVFHGPLGQVRVETETFLLEQSITRPGEFFYSVAQQRDEDGLARSLAQFDWGIGEHLAATGGIARTPVDGITRNYLKLGLKTHWRSMIASADLVKSEQGALTELGVRTRLGDWSINANHARLADFTSEWFQPSGNPIQSSSQLRVDGAVQLPGSSLRLPVTLEGRREQRESGSSNIDVTGRMSAHLRGSSATGQVRWQSFGGQELASTTLQISRRVDGVRLRSQVNYELLPASRLIAVALSADKRMGEGYLANAGIRRLFGSSETRYTVGLNKNLGSFGLGVSAGYSSSGEISAGLRLFLAMGREPHGGGWMFDAQPMANTGAASALVFLDENLNGRMDTGEMPIQDVGFTVNGSKHPVTTDARGLAYLARLPIMEQTDIGLSTATLDDPQWLPQRKGMRMVPRRGAVAELQFPVVTTSEIEGSVYLNDGAHRRAMEAVVVELVDESGNVVATSTSASDGYYVMTQVLPGEYEVRVSPDQLERLELRAASLRWVTASSDDWLVSGVDVELNAR